GDDVTVTVNSANFADKNAGTDKPVTIDYTLGGADLSNYAVTVDDADGVISRRTLTLEDVEVGEKIYDGTPDLDITIGEIDGVVPGEDVTVTPKGETPSSEPGTYEVTITFDLEGEDADNYDVPDPITVTVTVEPAPITDITFADAEYVYEKKARSIAVSGAQAGDVVLYSTDGETYSAALPEFTNVGEYTIYAKVSRTNYADWTGSATLTITKNVATIVLHVADKEYDGTTDATSFYCEVLCVYEGDDVTATAHDVRFAEKNVGDMPIRVRTFTFGGADCGNYNFSVEGGTRATITPKHLYAIFRAADKVYDGTADATASLVEYIGLVDGDDVTVDAVGAQFNDKNVGVKTASVEFYHTSGADAANYDIFGSIEGAVISAKQLSISGTTVADKYYDGTTDAEITAGTLSGVIDDETVTVTAAGAFPSADAGEYDVPVSYTLGGADAANYAAPAGETISAKINHLPTIDVTFDDASFVYNAQARSIAVAGTEAGDTVLYSTDGETYTAALPEYTNVGEYTIYAKVSRANYEDWTGSATLTITPATLTLTFTAENKTYDGSAAADAALAGMTGLIAGDDVTVTVNSASFADKNAGADKAVTVDYTVAGAQAGNYTVAAAGVTASISAASLTISYTAADKTYDGSADAAVTGYALNGLVAGDDVTVTVDSASFADANAGENKAVSVTRTVSGADVSNYAISDAAASATIAKKQLTVSGTTAADKVYDGTTAATVTLGEVSGIVAGDDVTVSATGQFAQAAVGTHDVTVTYAVAGAAASNYLAPETETLNATITQRDISDLSFTGGELHYDGEAHTFLLTGVQAGDEVRYSTDGISFDLTEAPSYTDVGAYTVYVKVTRPNHAEWIDDARLVITPATITVSAEVADKVYDGTTDATIENVTLHGVKDADAGLVNVTVEGAFCDKNVGELKAANLYFTLTGAKAGNYVLSSSTATVGADITKATITVTAVASDKVYDGTTDAQVTLAG
ncbi:MAG: hypothetical protein IKE69_04790, partial [Thermoguttaceae bacterium]|nr:hypothetical protein [Thermoguttaceae bacterium]